MSDKRKEEYIQKAVADFESVLREQIERAVSYTHLTLPTICSV